MINKIKINAKIPPHNKLYKKILEIFSLTRILSACGPYPRKRLLVMGLIDFFQRPNLPDPSDNT
jgi:hypothetical protein